MTPFDAEDEVPAARVHGRPWARLLSGPGFAITGPLAWAASQALAASVVQGVWFAIASDLGVLVLLAIAITAGIQWVVTTVAMFGVAQLAPMLHRQRRRAPARLVGAIIAALVAWTIERVAAGTYVSWFEGEWRGSFYGVALGVGALWGLWLPAVGPSSISVPPPP